jgi:hypothetical protein
LLQPGGQPRSTVEAAQFSGAQEAVASEFWANSRLNGAAVVFAVNRVKSATSLNFAVEYFKARTIWQLPPDVLPDVSVVTNLPSFLQSDTSANTRYRLLDVELGSLRTVASVGFTWGWTSAIGLLSWSVAPSVVDPMPIFPRAHRLTGLPHPLGAAVGAPKPKSARVPCVSPPSKTLFGWTA